MSRYTENLLKVVIEKSVANDWENAVLEWDIEDCEEDDYNESTCVCGKENIKYLYEIKNVKNENVIFPIGSTCIKKFGRDDLNEKTTINEKMFRLLHAIEDKKFINLDSEFFSRKLLEYFYEEGVFKPNKHNEYNPEKDYEFMLQMFNMRSKPPKSKQGKIDAIILNDIKPYLKNILDDKIKRKESLEE